MEKVKLEESQLRVIFGRTTELVDKALRSSMQSILENSYEDVHPLLRRELSHCDRVYLGQNAGGRLVCFFLAAFPTKDTPDEVYLGLSATSADTKNSGVVRSLYRRCAEEIRQKEAEAGRRFTVWFTTATPSAYYGGKLYWDCEPDEHGNASPSAKMAAASIQERLCGRHDPKHPFVLRGIASSVRYSVAERLRVEAVQRKTGFGLLAKLSINEREGDRLLVVAKSKASDAPSRVLSDESPTIQF